MRKFRLDTIEKMTTAFGISIKSLFDPIDDNTVEGYLKIKGKIYQFNSKEEFYSFYSNN